MSRVRLASEVGFGLRHRTEVELVRVCRVDQVVFYLGFAGGDLCHEVVVFGLALLILGPVRVAVVRGRFKAVLGIGRWDYP